MIQQRLSVCLFGFALLVACGSGTASNPPGPSSQDPQSNANSPHQSAAFGSGQNPIGNGQTAPTPGQRPAPASTGGVVVTVGPMGSGGDSSLGGRGNPPQGGSDNTGPGRGAGGGDPTADSATTGSGCTAANFCAGCSPTTDPCAFCHCGNALGGTQTDCTAPCN